MWRNVLTGAAVLALCATASAQTQTLSANHVKSKANTPVQYLGTYQMATDQWTPVANRNATRVLYNCTTPGNYYGAVGNSFTTAADQLWIDEGQILDTNSGMIDQVGKFDFSYCSSDIAPSANGGSILINFYDDYSPCSTPLSTTCSYIIGGLPMGTANGNTQCWAVSIDLSGGFECTTDPNAMFVSTGGTVGSLNGTFGWAFGSNPGLAGMNDTGPILDLPCARPLNGCSTGGSTQMNQNKFWWEDSTGAWTGCYWYGGVPFASQDMKMYGGSIGSFAYGYAGGANSLALSSTDFVAGNVTFTVTGGTPGNALYLLAGSAAAAMPLGNNELEVNFATFFPGIPLTMPATGVMTVSVPASISGAFAQVAETTGPASPGALVNMSNGLMLQM